MCLLQDRRAVSLHWPPPQFHWETTATLPQTPSTDESIVSFPHHTRPAAISLLQWLNWSITFYHPSFSKLSLSCKTTLRRSDIVVEIIWLSVCSLDRLSGWHWGVITAGEWVGLVIKGMYVQHKISIWRQLFRTFQFYNVVLITLLYFWIIIFRDNWGVSFHN